jgi:sialic acid synthase SpsE
MEAHEPPNERIIIVPIGRIDIDAISVLIALELYPAGECEINFRAMQTIHTELGSRISISDHDFVKALVGS